MLMSVKPGLLYSILFLLLWSVYEFPAAAVTNYHKLSCFKQQKFVLL